MERRTLRSIDWDYYLEFIAKVLRISILALAAVAFVVFVTACGNENDIGDKQNQQAHQQ